MGFYRLENESFFQSENALLTRTWSMTLRLRAKVLLDVVHQKRLNIKSGIFTRGFATRENTAFVVHSVK